MKPQTAGVSLSHKDTSHYLAHINPRLCYGAFCLNDSNYRFSPDVETTLLMSLFRLKEEPCLDCPHKRDSSFSAKHGCAARCVSALMRQNESSLVNCDGWLFLFFFNILFYICCFILANWQCAELAISISSLRCSHGGTDNYQWIHWILMKTSGDLRSIFFFLSFYEWHQRWLLQKV